jgi:hypothetical protein
MPSVAFDPQFLVHSFTSEGCNWRGIMPELTPEPILKVATGFMAAKQLAASEIGLFEALADGPASLEELAAKRQFRHVRWES